MGFLEKLFSNPADLELIGRRGVGPRIENAFMALFFAQQTKREFGSEIVKLPTRFED